MFGLRIAWGGNPAGVLTLAGDRIPARNELLLYQASKLPNLSPEAGALSGPSFLGNRNRASRRRFSGTVGKPKGS